MNQPPTNSTPPDAESGDPADEGRRQALVRGIVLAAGAGLAIAAVTRPRTAHAQDASGGDVSSLNNLLAAEYTAIQAYTVAGGYLASPTPTDPAIVLAPVVLAVGLHFQSQHMDHANILATTITQMGGTPVAQSTVHFTPPTGFTASVLNILKLATNAEKGAAIAYTQTLGVVSSQTAAEIVAAIGGTETQHFAVLKTVTDLLASPVPATGPDAGATTAMMAMQVVPRSFVVGQGTVSGLDSLPDEAYM